MKKKLGYILIIFVFIISIDTVCAFDIEEVLTTSESVNGNIQEKKINFEPGDSVWVYIYTKNHFTGCTNLLYRFNFLI